MCNRSLWVLLLIPFVVGCAGAGSAPAAPRRGAGDTDFETHIDNGNIAYRVWIPGGIPRLRGIVFASMGNNWDYRHFVEIPAWRAAARQWRFMLVGTGRKGIAQCDPSRLIPDVRKLLASAAAASRHPEIIHLPFCCFGFSMGAQFTRMLTLGLPERAIAGGMGGTAALLTDGDPPVPAAFKEIPFVVTIAELDQLVKADRWTEELPRRRREGYRLAVVTQWGLSHYEGNYECLLLIHFDRAIRRRLPPAWEPSQGPPALKSVPLEEGWLGSSEGCSAWSTMSVEAHRAPEFPGEPARASWLIDETMARMWQAFALRHNAGMLIRPFVDSMDYIPSRNLPDPAPAGRPLPLAALAHWFGNVARVEFYAGTERIGTAAVPTGPPAGEAFESSWERPAPGIYPVYAVLYDAGGRWCITKPYPLVVE